MKLISVLHISLNKFTNSEFVSLILASHGATILKKKKRHRSKVKMCNFCVKRPQKIQIYNFFANAKFQGFLEILIDVLYSKTLCLQRILIFKIQIRVLEFKIERKRITPPIYLQCNEVPSTYLSTYRSSS